MPNINRNTIVSLVVRGAFLMALGFVALRLGSPFLEGFEFRQLIHREVASHAVRPHPEEVREHILSLGREMGLNLSPDDITVGQFPLGRLRVRVDYSIPVNLVWYQYKLNFQVLAQTPTAAELHNVS